jgi:archaellin
VKKKIILKKTFEFDNKFRQRNVTEKVFKNYQNEKYFGLRRFNIILNNDWDFTIKHHQIIFKIINWLSIKNNKNSYEILAFLRFFCFKILPY